MPCFPREPAFLILFQVVEAPLRTKSQYEGPQSLVQHYDQVLIPIVNPSNIEEKAYSHYQLSTDVTGQTAFHQNKAQWVIGEMTMKIQNFL